MPQLWHGRDASGPREQVDPLSLAGAWRAAGRGSTRRPVVALSATCARTGVGIRALSNLLTALSNLLTALRRWELRCEGRSVPYGRCASTAAVTARAIAATRLVTKGCPGIFTVTRRALLKLQPSPLQDLYLHSPPAHTGHSEHSTAGPAQSAPGADSATGCTRRLTNAQLTVSRP